MTFVFSKNSSDIHLIAFQMQECYPRGDTVRPLAVNIIPFEYWFVQIGICQWLINDLHSTQHSTKYIKRQEQWKVKEELKIKDNRMCLHFIFNQISIFCTPFELWFIDFLSSANSALPAALHSSTGSANRPECLLPYWVVASWFHTHLVGALHALFGMWPELLFQSWLRPASC